MRRSLFVSLLAAAGLAGPASAADQNVAIAFGLTAAGKPAGCGGMLDDVGAAHLKAGLHDARIYVHDVKLIAAGGGRVPVRLDASEWQSAGVALLDFKDARGGRAPCSVEVPAKNTAVRGGVPPGSYTGIEFTVGVPVEAEISGAKVSLNHSNVDTAPPPLDVVAMNWSWQAGRKFIAIEVDPVGGFKRADGTPGRTWFVHLGSTGCTGNPATGEIVACKSPNRFRVTFERFDPAKDTVEIDLTALFKDSDLTVDKGGAIGCMSGPDDPECTAIFGTLGLNLAESKPGAGDAGQPTVGGRSPIFKVMQRR
jgi:uncharacterized repeat protein (TIGR04052 family)